MASKVRIPIALLLAAYIGASLVGCSSDSTASTSSQSAAVMISGTPPPSVKVGSMYRFAPHAAGASGTTLKFDIRNQPKWASFDSASGLLTGTPSANHVGTFEQIAITVNDGAVTAALPPFSISVTPTVSADNPVSISGSPALSVAAGAAYSFQPTATSANGGTLKFAVNNLPAWANFSVSTGAITGTPALSNVGKTSQIIISASDGKQSAELNSFVITVTDGTAVSADLSWTAPTTTTVGNLLNLAGFHIRYGRDPTSLSHIVDVSDAALTNYTVSNLTHGIWYFAVTAYSNTKIESTLSAVVAVTL